MALLKRNIFFFSVYACHFISEIQNTIPDYCPISIEGDLHFLDWPDHMCKYTNVYNKLYNRPLAKVLVLVWPIWIYKNNFIFREFDGIPSHITNLVVNLFIEMRYFNIISRIFVQDHSVGSHIDSKRKNWMFQVGSTVG